MLLIEKAEEYAGRIFKPLPRMSGPSRDSLVLAWPWIGLIFAALQLAAAYLLWKVANATQGVNDYLNPYAELISGQRIGLTTFETVVIGTAIAVLVVDAALLLLAFNKLRTRERSGWELLFAASLLNLIYAFLCLFISSRGFSSFLIGFLATAASLYLLLQVRGSYKAQPDTKD